MIKRGIICGFTSVILVMLLGQSRVFFAMARVPAAAVRQAAPKMAYAVALEPRFSSYS
jgi:amino acid transporter